MKISSPFLAALLFALPHPATAEEKPPKIAPAKVQNGVFVTNTGYMTTVLELKDGQFRYWFNSDDKSPDEPVYPLVGTYETENDRIVIDHPQVSQKEWTFRSVDGLVTLWRPDALKMQAEKGGYLDEYSLGVGNFRRCGTGAILVPDERTAEKAWAEPRSRKITKKQHGALQRKKKNSAD